MLTFEYENLYGSQMKTISFMPSTQIFGFRQLLVVIVLSLFHFTPALASGDREGSSEANLTAIVKYLSNDIGVRSCVHLVNLNKAAGYIEGTLRSYGCSVSRQPFNYDGKTYYNIVGEVKGNDATEKEILIIGAHYDTDFSTPGADDNASGIAALLELARLTALHPARRTIRFVAFSLEEPPVFGTTNMGSYIYAQSIKKEGVGVCGMIALEMVGYYCETKSCQNYPRAVAWLFPDKGNFISFVGNISSGGFTKKVKKSFIAQSRFPIETLNTFSWVEGVDFSDHANFWQFGYKAFMVTDTAFLRNRNYHASGDTWEKLDYKRMNQVVNALFHATASL